MLPSQTQGQDSIARKKMFGSTLKPQDNIDLNGLYAILRIRETSGLNAFKFVVTLHMPHVIFLLFREFR